MAQETAILEEIRNAVTETNLLFRVAFAEQLKAALQLAAAKAIGGDVDGVTNEILNRLFLRPWTAEELSSAICSQQKVSKRTIHRRLEKLVEAGLVGMDRREGSVHYRLHMEALI